MYDVCMSSIYYAKIMYVSRPMYENLTYSGDDFNSQFSLNATCLGGLYVQRIHNVCSLSFD